MHRQKYLFFKKPYVINFLSLFEKKFFLLFFLPVHFQEFLSFPYSSPSLFSLPYFFFSGSTSQEGTGKQAQRK